MATRFMYKAILTAAMGIPLSVLLAATSTTSSAWSCTIAQPASDQISTVFDPVGDASLDAAAFQDIVFGQMTKRASGDFELLMEVAGPVPVAPQPLPGVREVWWYWSFDLDPSTFPQGYPLPPGHSAYPEVIVYVSWDGTHFAGTTVDRRPLLTGGEVIITPIPFSIDGTIVEAVLASELIGDVPPTFSWGLRTKVSSGAVGSASSRILDRADSTFNP
jgi:hypothetical protein